MGVRYPGLVSRHNLVCSFVFMVPCPHLGPFCHDGGCRWLWWAWATHDLALRGSESEWPGECHGKGRVSSELRGPPEWECEALEFRSVGKVRYLCRVYFNLSIAASSVMDTTR